MFLTYDIARKMEIHARIDDDKTLCGMPITYVIKMGIRMPSDIIALDIAIAGNVPHVACRRCQKICENMSRNR